ncbi:MAG TPA: UdgX family uracil-DNA binding protein [Nocardioides sp.]|nr:UdgX family uracil-DNA binding protein [Nocardioides sp.]
MPDEPRLEDLYAAAQACRGCELYRDTTQAVVGVGPAKADLVIVGEQPGDVEDKEGEPFVGPAGRLLDRALEDAGIDRGSAYLTNAVKHFAHHLVGRRRIHDTPKAGQVTACAPWLRIELDLVGPTGVVLLGATAAKAVHGPSFRLTESRGRRLDWPERYPLAATPRWNLVTLHPSAVLRSEDRDAAYAGLVADLRVAAELSGRC